MTCKLNMRRSPFTDKEQIFDMSKNLKLKVDDAVILTHLRLLLQR